MRLKKPTLSEVLSVVLPTTEQTLLLRACLWKGEPGRQAWAEWCDRVRDPISLLREGNEALKGLLPLIFAALRDRGIVVEEALQTCLHTAALREELRINTYRRILSQVLSSFTEKQVPIILVTGAALADTVYESPSLRHSGEIKILLGEQELPRPVTSLIPPGFARLYGVNSGLNETRLKHGSGISLRLSRSLFPISYYEIPFDDLWARSQIRPIAEVPTRILSPTDSLMHVCVNAFFNRSRRTLLWVFDSWFIMKKYPNLDWDDLLETARRSHLELPLSVTIGFLVEELGAPIPASFLEQLYSATSKTDKAGRAYGLSVVRDEVRGNYIKMFLISREWRVHAYLLSWILHSPINHLQWFSHNCRPKLSRYLPQPLCNLVSRIQSFCKNLARQLRGNQSAQ